MIKEIFFIELRVTFQDKLEQGNVLHARQSRSSAGHTFNLVWLHKPFVGRGFWLEKVTCRTCCVKAEMEW